MNPIDRLIAMRRAGLGLAPPTVRML